MTESPEEFISGSRVTKDEEKTIE